MQVDKSENDEKLSTLPDELWVEIASYVNNPSDLVNMRLSCSFFDRIAQDQRLWLQACIDRGYINENNKAKLTSEASAGMPYTQFFKFNIQKEREVVIPVDVKQTYYVVGENIPVSREKNFFELTVKGEFDTASPIARKNIKGETIKAAFPKKDPIMVFKTREEASQYAKSQQTVSPRGNVTTSTPAIFEVKLEPIHASLKKKNIRLGNTLNLPSQNRPSVEVEYFTVKQSDISEISKGSIYGRKETVDYTEKKKSLGDFLKRK